MGKKREARQKRGVYQSTTFALIVSGLVVIVGYAYPDVQIVIGGVAGVSLLLAVLYLIDRIVTWAKKRETARRQTEGMRDSRYIAPSLRQAVWTKCGGRCMQCQSESLLEYDHIIPLSKGGATSYGNLQILCRTCNRHKSDRI